MEVTRKPFQGVTNIIRFNWHYYVWGVLVLTIFFIINQFWGAGLKQYFIVVIGLTALSMFISLLVSYYVYDLSNLYFLPWSGESHQAHNSLFLNIHAGFDETSEIIQQKYPGASLIPCDFYDPAKHTEVSIKRARNAYPPRPGTRKVNPGNLPFQPNTFDKVFVILSAHEIRNQPERVLFFKELKRVAKGEILITEHLRDLNNFWAYTLGFFHFYSRANWLNVFKNAGLTLKQELKTTPFITTFILE